MNYIIDYLTITIKPDKKSKTPYCITYEEFYKILGLSTVINNFIDIGGKNYYEHCYKYNNINLCIPYDKKYYDMGYCLSMTGSGCRFFESIQDKKFTWKQFFKKLYKFVEKGCKVNIARIDFAFDDIIYKDEEKQPLLNLETIEEHRINTLFTSLYRKSEKKLCEEFQMKTSIKESKRGSSASSTIYFGSHKSNSFCRFYDKLVEQKQKCKSNPQELEKLEKISHWVRFEIIFKNKSAIKIINSMIYLSDEQFNRKFAETINYYISFINPDNDNRYKCSICEWWAKFLGTVEKAKLTSAGIVKNVFRRSIDWLIHSVVPTLRAVEESVGTLVLLDIVHQFGHQGRWKQRHYEISSSNDTSEQAVTNEMYWRSLIPFFCDNATKQTKNCVTEQDLREAVPLDDYVTFDDLKGAVAL